MTKIGRKGIIFGTNGNDLLNIGDEEGHGVGVDGLAGNDTIIGSSFGDSLVGNIGNDRILGAGGNDYITGGPGNDYMNGGLGADFVFYSDAVASVFVDLAVTVAQNTGGGGIDTILNFELISGSNFNDILSGNVFGNGLYGGLGNDVLVGRGGNDTLQGYDGNDTLLGGDGVDYLEAGVGNDSVDGGLGIDQADYFGAVSGITLNLSVTTAQNTGGSGLDTVLNVENVLGSTFGDTITGSAGANKLYSNGGADILSGLGGNDILDNLGGGTSLGGNGIDTLYGGAVMNGGAGNDQLFADGSINRISGGLGADNFIYDSIIGSGWSYPDFFDTITDFNPLQGDKIDLHNALFDVTFIGSAAYTSFVGHSELRVSAGVGFQIVEADLTGDRISDFYLKVIGNTPLVESDLIF